MNVKILYERHHSPSHVYCCLIFKNNLSIGTTPTQNCCRKKEWHKDRRREKEKERVLKSCFLDPLLYKTLVHLFFPCP
jgi:hypothetical protein